VSELVAGLTERRGLLYSQKNERTELVDGEPTNVILYGQSVGSGPCCHLAASEGELRGMILHSPFTSGMHVLTPSR
jgi:hypothetical protein